MPAIAKPRNVACNVKPTNRIKRTEMEFKIHKVVAEEKLTDISEKYNVSIDEIKKANPNARVFKSFFGAEYAAHLQELKIPVHQKIIIKEVKTDFPFESIVFNSKARYRCEQTNITKVNSVLTSYTNQKTQYLLEQNLKEYFTKTKLEEFIYEVVPPVLESSFELIKETEFIKNNAYFKLNKNGKIEDILNRNAIFKKWEQFRNSNFKKLDFIKSLERNPESINKIEKTGNEQFKNLNIKEYQNALFNFVCFDQFLYKPFEELEKEEFLYPSTILPSNIIPLEFRFDKVREDKELITIKKIATPQLSEKLTEELIKEYNKILKPTLKFGFTEFKVFFSSIIEFNTTENIVEKASVNIREEIADNIENTCEFTLTRLHNYTPE